MFLYTPNKKILDELLRARRNDRRNWYQGDRERDLVYGYFNDHESRLIFRRYWEHAKFYSLLRLRQVPVNGVLMDVRFFDETEVKPQM